MFRYLEKYVGTYRVLPILTLDNDFPRDENGNIDEDYDDLYIPCNKGIIIHSYTPYLLVWYTPKIKTGKKIRDQFEKNSIKIFDYEETDGDVLVWFDKNDMKKVAKIVKPKIVGKGIQPFSKKNLVKQKLNYEIPESDLNDYNRLFFGLSTVDKMHFAKSVNKKFMESSNNPKFKEEKNNSGLDFKEYVHSKGMWNRYIDFIKNERKNI